MLQGQQSRSSSAVENGNDVGVDDGVVGGGSRTRHDTMGFGGEILWVFTVSLSLSFSPHVLGPGAVNAARSVSKLQGIITTFGRRTPAKKQ